MRWGELVEAVADWQARTGIDPSDLWVNVRTEYGRFMDVAEIKGDSDCTSLVIRVERVAP